MNTTLNQHLASVARDNAQAEDLNAVLRELASAVKHISAGVKLGPLSGALQGATGDRNVHGEEVQKLDIYANEILIQKLSECSPVGLMASEENEDPIPMPDHLARGKYIVTIDPLDGSSNIDTNASIGTIFSILKARGEEADWTDFLHPEAEQVAAGYAIYGSSTIFVYTARHGVHGFTLDPSLDEFLLSHPDIHCPPQGAIYSVNEGYASYWSKPQRDLVEWCKAPDEATQRPYKSRYIGSLVADFHRTLMKGGIFMYPADSKNPRGKLRFLYEVAPLALVCEEAGGAASDGTQRILNIVPKTLHERVPVYIGSHDLVKKATEILATSGY